jgi:hypothetical protein
MNQGKRIKKALIDRYLLFLIAASIFSIYFISTSLGFRMGPDGSEYIATGYQIFHPEIYGYPTAYISPFYPIILRTLFLFNNLLIFKFFHYFLAFLVPLMIYFALKPFHRLTAFLTAIIVVFDFNSMFHFTTVCVENLYIFSLVFLLFSFCRLLDNPHKLVNIYLHGLSLFFVFIIRAAGRYLFIFLLPFYYIFYLKSRKTFVHLMMSFLIPYVIYIFLISNIQYNKFPTAIAPLTFFRYNNLIHYDKNESFRQLVDLVEEIYFEKRLPKEGKRKFIKDMENYDVYTSVLLVDIGWSGYPEEFEELINRSLRNSLSDISLLELFKTFKTIFASFLVYNKFNPLGSVYNFYTPLKNLKSNYKDEVAFKRKLFKERYGGDIRRKIIKYYYNKYSKINYDILYQDKTNPANLPFLFRVNRVFILLFTYFVYLLAMIIITLSKKEAKTIFIVSLFGLIIIIYHFLATMLFVVQERYRAPVDMFYFIPIGWLYAKLFIRQGWSKCKKMIVIFLLLFCIILNLFDISTIFGFFRKIRVFLHLP